MASLMLVVPVRALALRLEWSICRGRAKFI